ncbi:MAG: hypothetical protein ACO3RV_05225, partial [Luteolibacter sp.]
FSRRQASLRQSPALDGIQKSHGGLDDQFISSTPLGRLPTAMIHPREATWQSVNAVAVRAVPS